MGLIPPIRKDLAHVFHVPLAGYGLMIQMLSLGISIYNGARILNSQYAWWRDSELYKGYLGPEDATMLTFISLLVLIALCGFVGILTRWKIGLRLVGIGFIILLITCIVSVVATLLVWFFTLCHVGGARWAEYGIDLFHDLIILGLQILVCLISWHTLSGFKSLQYVIAYGGTGWEKLTYKELRSLMLAEAYLDDLK